MLFITLKPKNPHKSMIPLIIRSYMCSIFFVCQNEKLDKISKFQHMVQRMNSSPWQLWKYREAAGEVFSEDYV